MNTHNKFETVKDIAFAVYLVAFGAWFFYAVVLAMLSFASQSVGGQPIDVLHYANPLRLF